MKNYYRLLGVSENATELEIQMAYKNRYQKCLYDKAGNVNIEEKMIDILVAYNALTNKKIKQEYDQLLKNDPVDITEYSPTDRTGMQFRMTKANLIRGISVTLLAFILFYAMVLSSNLANNRKDTGKVAAAVKPKGIGAISKDIPAEQKLASASHIYDSPNETGKVQATDIDKKYQYLHPHKSQPTNIASETNVLATASMDKTASNIQQGSIKDDVLKMRGTPNAIVRFDNENEVWCYSNEKISFTNGIAMHIQPN